MGDRPGGGVSCLNQSGHTNGGPVGGGVSRLIGRDVGIPSLFLLTFHKDTQKHTRGSVCDAQGLDLIYLCQDVFVKDSHFEGCQ